MFNRAVKKCSDLFLNFSEHILKICYIQCLRGKNLFHPFENGLNSVKIKPFA